MTTRSQGNVQLYNHNQLETPRGLAGISAQHLRDNDPHPHYVRKNGTPLALTIASGIVTASKGYHTLAGQGGLADDLDTINGGRDGTVVVVRAVNTAVTITVKHATGNILLDGATDYALDNSADTLMLLYDATLAKWLEIGRGNNGV